MEGKYYPFRGDKFRQRTRRFFKWVRRDVKGYRTRNKPLSFSNKTSNILIFNNYGYLLNLFVSQKKFHKFSLFRTKKVKATTKFKISISKKLQTSLRRTKNSLTLFKRFIKISKKRLF